MRRNQIIPRPWKSKIMMEKHHARSFWHMSKSEAFCPYYWVLDYKQGRKAGNSISDQTWYTHYDVSGK
jgi:hypothetical protein